MSIATFNEGKLIGIDPFDRETESTVFISGILRIIDLPDGKQDALVQDTAGHTNRLKITG